MIAIPVIVAACFVAPQSSSLDRLEAKRIPASKRYAGQPEELVAVAGERRAFEGESLNWLAFHPEGRLLAVATMGQTVRLWDLGGSEPKEGATVQARGQGCLDMVAFTRDGQRLAVLGWSGVGLWDVGGPAPKEQAVIEDGVLRTLALSSDGKTLAIGDTAGAVRLWDLSGARPKRGPEIKGPENEGYVRKVALSPDGKLLATGNFSGTVRLWDLTGAAPREHAALRGDLVFYALAFSPDGKRLVTNDLSGAIHAWDVTNSEPRGRPSLKGHKGYPNRLFSVAFLRDGRTCATLCSSSAGEGGDVEGELFFWDLETGKKLRELRLPKARFHCMVLAADGRHLAVVDEGSVVYLFRLAPAPSR